jgi:hypothetical protein
LDIHRESHPSTGKVLSLAEERSRHQRQRALNHFRFAPF